VHNSIAKNGQRVETNLFKAQGRGKKGENNVGLGRLPRQQMFARVVCDV
jgi:hypothetical protein